MLPVAGKPLVAHTASAAIAAGASRLILVLGYQGELVEKYFGDKYDGVPVDRVTQERQRGTADAVRAASDALDPGPFAVLNGDALYDINSLSASLPLSRTGTAMEPMSG